MITKEEEYELIRLVREHILQRIPMPGSVKYILKLLKKREKELKLCTMEVGTWKSVKFIETLKATKSELDTQSTTEIIQNRMDGKICDE